MLVSRMSVDEMWIGGRLCIATAAESNHGCHGGVIPSRARTGANIKLPTMSSPTKAIAASFTRSSKMSFSRTSCRYVYV